MQTMTVASRRRMVAELMARRERGNLEGFLRLFTSDCEVNFPGALIQGIDQWRDFQRAYLDAFPDGKYDVRYIEPVGDVVFVEGIWSATHTGALVTPDGVLEPTGRAVTVPFALVVTIRDGLVSTVHNYHDRLDFLAQLGAIPAPAAS